MADMQPHLATIHSTTMLIALGVFQGRAGDRNDLAIPGVKMRIENGRDRPRAGM